MDEQVGAIYTLLWFVSNRAQRHCSNSKSIYEHSSINAKSLKFSIDYIMSVAPFTNMV